MQGSKEPFEPLHRPRAGDRRRSSGVALTGKEPSEGPVLVPRVRVSGHRVPGTEARRTGCRQGAKTQLEKGDWISGV